MAGLTRREWLRATGVGAAAAWLPWSGCSDAAGIEATGLVLDVEHDRAIISVWAASGSQGEVSLVEEAGGGPAVRAPVVLAEGGAGWIDLTGLRPATAYVASMRVGDTELPPYRFVTAPALDDPRPVRIAVGADLDPDPAYDSPMFESLAAVGADVFVSLGDWPYADNPPFTGTIENCRFRHVEARSAARLQAWLTRTSVRAIYDDHEVRNDWDAATWTAERAVHDMGLAVWDEFFPRRSAGPRYQRWRWGAHVEAFLLDTRRYRSPRTDADVAGKTMLGAEQHAWLLDGVTTSAAPFKLVLTTVPLAHGHGIDHWSGYTVERDGILDALADAGTPGVLFVSADQHWFGAYVHRHGAREFQVGPLARSPFMPPAPGAPGVLATASEYNAGVIDVDAGGLRFRAISAAGNALYDETFRPEDLRLRR